MVSSDHVRPKLVTPALIQHIQNVIRDTIVPSWIESVPKNYGEAAAGTLKADEWRTLATVYLPIALISIGDMISRTVTPLVPSAVNSLTTRCASSLLSDL
ncbi:MAG TPA: hypothetical protein VGO47_03810 [Chlamydiales bacterium]|nr:hypothetical protein [Chlamydiales bacterium]